MLEVIFERFLQVTSGDRRGVGLGLYIAKRIVQRHGGQIWAESQIGEGSTFFFTLPIYIRSEGSDLHQRFEPGTSGGMGFVGGGSGEGSGNGVGAGSGSGFG
jgi:histidine kinase/DNA gyrase B/HSP90-like ATPase